MSLRWRVAAAPVPILAAAAIVLVLFAARQWIAAIAFAVAAVFLVRGAHDPTFDAPARHAEGRIDRSHGSAAH